MLTGLPVSYIPNVQFCLSLQPSPVKLAADVHILGTHPLIIKSMNYTIPDVMMQVNVFIIKLVLTNS